jgi:hypothetical protein
MQKFPDIIFYDYSKYPPTQRKDLPENYHLTHSYSEKKEAEEWRKGWEQRGVNSAVVFSELPAEWRGSPVINGDESDLRFNDPTGVIVGLKVKGKARKNSGNGFVQNFV